MIHVSFPATHVAERQYVIKHLLETHLELENISYSSSEKSSDYTISFGTRSVIFEDHFFGNVKANSLYISEKNLPDSADKASHEKLNEVTVLYGRDHYLEKGGNIYCGVDLFASAFFMLSRWEECLDHVLDLHGRVPIEQTIPYQLKFYNRPIVDEYAQLLRTLLSDIAIAIVPSRKFKKIFTHDVDIPYQYLDRPLVNILGGNLSREGSITRLLKTWKDYNAVKNGKLKDPNDHFEMIMDLSDERGIKSVFNFIAGGTTRYERYYKIDQPLIRKLISRIVERGHHIGLHGSYKTWMDSKRLDYERKKLESICGFPIKMNRQHYLRFSVPKTWKVLEKAGMTDDSTVGYAEIPGFRCGTSIPFRVFDCIERKELNVVEHPLIIMDVSLKNYQNWSPDECISHLQKIIDNIKKHNGELVILWHNSSFEKEGWKKYREVYEYMLDY